MFIAPDGSIEILHSDCSTCRSFRDAESAHAQRVEFLKEMALTIVRLDATAILESGEVRKVGSHLRIYL